MLRGHWREIKVFKPSDKELVDERIGDLSIVLIMKLCTLNSFLICTLFLLYFSEKILIFIFCQRHRLKNATSLNDLDFTRPRFVCVFIDLKQRSTRNIGSASSRALFNYKFRQRHALSLFHCVLCNLLGNLFVPIMLVIFVFIG